MATWLQFVDERHFINLQTGELYVGDSRPAGKVVSAGKNLDLSRGFLAEQLCDGFDITAETTSKDAFRSTYSLVTDVFKLSCRSREATLDVGDKSVTVIPLKKKFPKLMLSHAYHNLRCKIYNRYDYDGKLLFFADAEYPVNIEYGFKLGLNYVMVFYGHLDRVYVVFDENCNLLTVYSREPNVLIPKENENKSLNAKLSIFVKGDK